MWRVGFIYMFGLKTEERSVSFPGVCDIAVSDVQIETAEPVPKEAGSACRWALAGTRGALAGGSLRAPLLRGAGNRLDLGEVTAW